MNKENYFGSVYRTIKEGKGGLIVARRVRKNPDGTKFKTTEKIELPKNVWVVNSRGETTRFDISKFRKDIKLHCYGKLHFYEEHLEAMCDSVRLAIISSVSSHEQKEKKKIVSTEIIEEAAFATMNEIPTPEIVRFRYMARFCIDSIPKDELESAISSNFDDLIEDY